MTVEIGFEKGSCIGQQVAFHKDPPCKGIVLQANHIMLYPFMQARCPCNVSSYLSFCLDAAVFM
jgi:hypothetical protein